MINDDKKSLYVKLIRNAGQLNSEQEMALGAIVNQCLESDIVRSKMSGIIPALEVLIAQNPESNFQYRFLKHHVATARDSDSLQRAFDLVMRHPQGQDDTSIADIYAQFQAVKQAINSDIDEILEGIYTDSQSAAPHVVYIQGFDDFIHALADGDSDALERCQNYDATKECIEGFGCSPEEMDAFGHIATSLKLANYYLLSFGDLVTDLLTKRACFSRLNNEFSADIGAAIDDARKHDEQTDDIKQLIYNLSQLSRSINRSQPLYLVEGHLNTVFDTLFVDGQKNTTKAGKLLSQLCPDFYKTIQGMHALWEGKLKHSAIINAFSFITENIEDLNDAHCQRVKQGFDINDIGLNAEDIIFKLFPKDSPQSQPDITFYLNPIPQIQAIESEDGLIYDYVLNTQGNGSLQSLEQAIHGNLSDVQGLIINTPLYKEAHHQIRRTIDLVQAEHHHFTLDGLAYAIETHGLLSSQVAKCVRAAKICMPNNSKNTILLHHILNEIDSGGLQRKLSQVLLSANDSDDDMACILEFSCTKAQRAYLGYIHKQSDAATRARYGPRYFYNLANTKNKWNHVDILRNHISVVLSQPECIYEWLRQKTFLKVSDAELSPKVTEFLTNIKKLSEGLDGVQTLSELKDIMAKAKSVFIPTQFTYTLRDEENYKKFSDFLLELQYLYRVTSGEGNTAKKLVTAPGKALKDHIRDNEDALADEHERRLENGTAYQPPFFSGEMLDKRLKCREGQRLAQDIVDAFPMGSGYSSRQIYSIPTIQEQDLFLIECIAIAGDEEQGRLLRDGHLDMSDFDGNVDELGPELAFLEMPTLQELEPDN